MSQYDSFSAIFQNGTMFRPAIETRVLSSSFDSLSIVSAAWKFFLVIAPRAHSPDFAHPQEWVPLLERLRGEFSELRARVLPLRAEDGATHPLDRSADSVWAQYFRDEETKAVIQRDVDRLYQCEAFFRDGAVLRAVAAICFLHVRRFPASPYQQGFHELCGVLYWVYHREMRERGGARPFAVLFDAAHLDADVFWSYAAVLELLEPYYRRGADGEATHLLERCDFVQKGLLARYAPDAAAALAAHGVYPVQYLVPWLRVAFARLYPLDDAVKIWTRAFALGRPFVEALAGAVLFGLRDAITAAPSPVEVYHALMHSDPPPLAPAIEMALAEAGAGRAAPAARVESICAEMEAIVERADWFAMPVGEITTAIAVFRDALRSLTAGDVKEPERAPEEAVAQKTPPREPPVEPLPKASDGATRTFSILVREGTEEQPRRNLFARARTVGLFE
jgi:hypothetical protein